MAGEVLGNAHSLVPKKVKVRDTPEVLGELANSAQELRAAMLWVDENDPLYRILGIKASLREWLIADEGHCLFRGEVLQAFEPEPGTELEKVDLDIIVLECFAESDRKQVSERWPVIDSDVALAHAHRDAALAEANHNH